MMGAGRRSRMAAGVAVYLTLFSIATCETQVRAQDTYYYRNGQKVTLKLNSKKHYVLLKPETKRPEFEKDAKSTATELRRFDAVKPISNLDRVEQTPLPAFKWAIVENTDLEAKALGEPALADDIVYQAPFLLAPNGKEVGMSHLVYVKLKKDANKSKLEEMANELKVEILGSNKLMPQWYTLSCSKNSTGNALEVANKLYESGNFAVAEPDFLADFKIQCATDAHFAAQWGMKNTGQAGGTAGMDIRICDAWNYSTGDGVVVAVVDQGIELNHPDLPHMSASSYDTVNASSPSTVRGNHGTACAGIIGAARSNGGLGVAGVAPDTTLMSVSDSLQLGPNAQQNLASGLSWAWQNGADVISNSWGHDLLASSLIDDAIHDALTQGRGGKGCVVAFAAGNNNGTILYPARSNPDILVVGAMSPCGERKSFTSCDPESFWGSCYGATLDVVAPGVLIPTTDRQGAAGYDSGDYAMTFNGTSSATPHVAGLAALILAESPDLTQSEVATIIESHARKVGTYTYQATAGRPNGDWHQEMGYGLIDANACLAAARAHDGPTKTVAGRPGTKIGKKNSESVAAAPHGTDEPGNSVAQPAVKPDRKDAPRGSAKGIALAIGLNSVDPGHYAGWSGDLNACENDANDMSSIATSKGYQATTLLTTAATRKAVFDQIKKAATDLKSGDMFILSYSGHGGQVPDQNGDEVEGLDETWCLYDGELIDDELAALWPKFAAGVRILVFSDSCHSGTVTKFREYEQIFTLSTIDVADAMMWNSGFGELLNPPTVARKRPISSPVRAMPLKIVNATFQKNRDFYEKLGKAVETQKKSEDSTVCTVLLISGCQDNQLSADGAVNGLFTAKLKYIWDSGRFAGDYRDFHSAIVRSMPSYQSPNYYVIGAPNVSFERQTPFTR